MTDTASQIQIPDKSVWGPQFWGVMKTAAAGIGPSPPPELQEETKKFYYSLMWMLPCPECREHYAALWDERPIDPYLVSNARLLEWVSDIQSEVTKFIRKQEALKAAKSKLLGSTLVVEDSVVKSLPRSLRTSSQPSQPLQTAQRSSFYTPQKTRGVSGTPAALTEATTKKQSRALERLQRSAKYYNRGCSC